MKYLTYAYSESYDKVNYYKDIDFWNNYYVSFLKLWYVFNTSQIDHNSYDIIVYNTPKYLLIFKTAFLSYT